MRGDLQVLSTGGARRHTFARAAQPFPGRKTSHDRIARRRCRRRDGKGLAAKRRANSVGRRRKGIQGDRKASAVNFAACETSNHGTPGDRREAVFAKSIVIRKAPRQSPRARNGKSAMAFRFFLPIVALLLATGAARAETIDVSDNHGGRVADYDARWSDLAARGVSVRIVGPCQSACTVLLGHIPRSRILCHAGGEFRLSPRQVRGLHSDAVAGLFRRHPAMDHSAWRPDPGVYLDAGAGHLSLFQEMLGAGARR